MYDLHSFLSFCGLSFTLLMGVQLTNLLFYHLCFWGLIIRNHYLTQLLVFSSKEVRDLLWVNFRNWCEVWGSKFILSHCGQSSCSSNMLLKRLFFPLVNFVGLFVHKCKGLFQDSIPLICRSRFKPLPPELITVA